MFEIYGESCESPSKCRVYLSFKSFTCADIICWRLEEERFTDDRSGVSCTTSGDETRKISNTRNTMERSKYGLRICISSTCRCIPSSRIHQHHLYDYRFESPHSFNKTADPGTPRLYLINLSLPSTSSQKLRQNF